MNRSSKVDVISVIIHHRCADMSEQIMRYQDSAGVMVRKDTSFTSSGRKQLWVLYDGKPGHLSQSLGLAERLAQREAVDVHVIRASISGPLRLLALLLCRLPFMPDSLARWLYRFSAPAGKPDIVISFGGKVVPLNLALTHKHGCSNILIGNRYHLEPERFTVLVNVRDEGLTNQVVTPIPFSRSMSTKLDNQELQCLDMLRAADKPLWGVLLGGDGSGYSYSRADWQALIDTLPVLARRYGIRWIVSNSRRTPSYVSSMLDNPDIRACCEYVIDVHHKPESIKPLLQASARLFVGEDSLTMLSEAVSCDVPVVSLVPQRVTEMGGVHATVVSHYRQSGLIKTVLISELTALVLADEGEFVPLTKRQRPVVDQILSLVKTSHSRQIGTLCH